MKIYRFRVTDMDGACPYPVFDEEPEPLCWLLQGYLMDADGQEDLYLAEIAHAETGKTVTDLYNNRVDAQLYPDGRVILEELRNNEQDEIERGPPARIEITLAEAKRLILDWLAAKQEWYAQRDGAAKTDSPDGSASA